MTNINSFHHSVITSSNFICNLDFQCHFVFWLGLLRISFPTSGVKHSMRLLCPSIRHSARVLLWLPMYMMATLVAIIKLIQAKEKAWLMKKLLASLNEEALSSVTKSTHSACLQGNKSNRYSGFRSLFRCRCNPTVGWWRRRRHCKSEVQQNFIQSVH